MICCMTSTQRKYNIAVVLLPELILVHSLLYLWDSPKTVALVCLGSCTQEDMTLPALPVSMVKGGARPGAAFSLSSPSSESNGSSQRCLLYQALWLSSSTWSEAQQNCTSCCPTLFTERSLLLFGVPLCARRPAAGEQSGFLGKKFLAVGGTHTRSSCTSCGSCKPRAISRASVIVALMLEQLMQLRRAPPEAAGRSASASAFCTSTSKAFQQPQNKHSGRPFYCRIRAGYLGTFQQQPGPWHIPDILGVQTGF